MHDYEALKKGPTEKLKPLYAELPKLNMKINKERTKTMAVAAPEKA